MKSMADLANEKSQTVTPCSDAALKAAPRAAQKNAYKFIAIIALILESD